MMLIIFLFDFSKMSSDHLSLSLSLGVEVMIFFLSICSPNPNLIIVDSRYEEHKMSRRESSIFFSSTFDHHHIIIVRFLYDDVDEFDDVCDDREGLGLEMERKKKRESIFFFFESIPFVGYQSLLCGVQIYLVSYFIVVQ